MISLTQEAVILGLSPYGEADLIVTALLSGHGVRRFFARQARKSSRRFGSLLDHFAILTLIYREKPSGLWMLDEAGANPRSSLFSQNIRNNLDAFALLSLLAEVITAFSPDGGEETGLFSVWLDVLRRLESGDVPTELARIVLTQCLSDFGYGPGLGEDLPELVTLLNHSQKILNKPLKSAPFFLAGAGS